MADDERWPMPRYRAPDQDCLHALGVIAQNFNQFEFSFFRIFAHHLERLNVPIDVSWNFYQQLQDNKRPIATKALFSRCESDQLVTDHVNHAWDFFHRCNNNRNHIFHSQLDQSSLSPSSVRFSKAVKDDWDTVNLIDADLGTLRRVADDMFTGWEYVWDIWAYLQRRDLLAKMIPLFAIILPSTLPQKPDLPHSLNPDQNPRVQSK